MTRSLPLLLALGCGAPEPPAPSALPPKEAPPVAPHGAPGVGRPGARDEGKLQLTLNVVGVEDGRLHAWGPLGEQRLALAPNALPTPPPAAGQTWLAEARPGPNGPAEVLRVYPHHGLEVVYGTVAALDERSLALDTAQGRRDFVRHPWSDLPAGLAPGEYVGVKLYHTTAWRGHAAGQAILNARRHPGRPAMDGVAVRSGPEGLVVSTLAGTWTVPAPAEAPSPGQALSLTYTLDAAGRATEVRWTPLDGPLRFTGKLSELPAEPGRVRIVDVWGNLLGVLAFGLGEGVTVPAETRPGDLLEVTYDFDAEGRPVARALTPRVLSPVWFGRIEALDATSVRLTTLQKQPREGRLDADTFQPVPVRVGDMADVIWEPGEAGAPPRVRAIVKE